MSTKPTRDLKTFPNPNPGRDYEISFETAEFTCLCPMTAQPDFATIRIRYVPDERCVEPRVHFDVPEEPASRRLGRRQEHEPLVYGGDASLEQLEHERRPLILQTSRRSASEIGRFTTPGGAAELRAGQWAFQ